ncbi:uncharacterized protein N7525_000393 [Penicillium rubens]|uniref:uncharacterized protein n=1 Tax=Penicillium rubens TaxID=1108849 RepID=UPI002A5A3958|nr:uncharacterized protein N7525_000393 [Penicillium rubens]KAJ5842652.1 hypothetical protein N7525_000393 [Penicillium rubens]KAJ5846776.1 hypothetical protein N7534_010445 [Penicillium rubens]
MVRDSSTLHKHRSDPISSIKSLPNPTSFPPTAVREEYSSSPNNPDNIDFVYASRKPRARSTNLDTTLGFFQLQSCVLCGGPQLIPPSRKWHPRPRPVAVVGSLDCAAISDASRADSALSSR